MALSLLLCWFIAHYSFGLKEVVACVATNLLSFFCGYILCVDLSVMRPAGGVFEIDSYYW